MDQLNNMIAKYNSHGLDGATIAIQKLSGIVTQQAMVMSFIDVFLILTGLFGTLVFCAFLIKKPQPVPTGAGGGH